jgi:hypothetical protein
MITLMKCDTKGNSRHQTGRVLLRRRKSVLLSAFTAARRQRTARRFPVALGTQLDWVDVGNKDEEALAVVAERLGHDGGPSCLSSDNAQLTDLLKPYLPSGGSSQVLIISTTHTWRAAAAQIENSTLA